MLNSEEYLFVGMRQITGSLGISLYTFIFQHRVSKGYVRTNVFNCKMVHQIANYELNRMYKQYLFKEL